MPEILSHLNGQQYLVVGNHDQAHPKRRKHRAAIQRYLEYGFKEVHFQLDDFYGFVVNHMPYASSSSYDARYMKYRPEDTGKWLLHGHIHQAYVIHGRQINVGVDAWDYKPVKLDRLIKIREEFQFI